MYHMWDMHNRTTAEQARINRDRSNGKNTGLEDTATLYDADDVSVRVASSGVVHASTRPNNSAVSSGECGHGGNDRCICGLAQ